MVRSPKQSSAYPAPPTDRPRVFARSVSDDEMTTLMPRKGALAQFSRRAPEPQPQRAPASRPKPVLMEEPTRAFVRPSSPPPPNVNVEPTPMPMPMPAFPKANMRNLARPAPRQEMMPASMMPVAAPKQDSDAKIDPPATVITTRTRVIAPRPTVSWAAALVAMGVFVGLVTAVIARGDADSLIDATASFVDPSGSHAAGSANAAIASLQSKFVPPSATLPSTPDTTLLPSKDDDQQPKSVALTDLPTASPMPQKPAPVAYAAPARPAPRPAWHPTPRPAAPAPSREAREAKEDKVAAASKAPAAAPAAKKHASDDDVESASAADALAKAQLEASLR